MKRIHLTLIVALSVLLAAAFLINGNRGGQAAPAEPQATPDQPHTVVGRARVDGIFVPEGTRISAWCNGVNVTEEPTIDYEGEAWYVLDIPAENPSIPGCNSSEVISFKIAGFDADQDPVPWAAGGYTELDLTATSTPLDPHHVAGLVRVNGALVPAGITISAWCGGFQFASSSTDSQAFYSLDVPSDDLSTPGKDGCTDGETVTFKIGAIDAVETLAWHGGQTSGLDLSATSQPPGDYQVYGQVRVNGELVGRGVRISAWCHGIEIKNTSTDSDAYYSLLIPGDDPFTPQIEGCGSGEKISFMIVNLEADQSVNWGNGVSPYRLDLSADGDIGYYIFLPLILK
jgi:hypothetical protein